MQMDMDVLKKEIEDASIKIKELEREIEKVIVGQKDMIKKILIGILSDGHLLLEGVPGLAKTTAVKTFASAINAQFSRIQFTPDLLPADLIGTQIYDYKTGSFSIKKGPVFTNILLADEINRAPAKVQSALLEVMQEKQVTIGEQTFKVTEPYLVLATENPIEQEGTYPLPEAQVDRFMLKILINYPSREEEKEIMKRVNDGLPPVNKVVEPEFLLMARNLVRKIHMDEKVKEYIVNLVFATRKPSDFGLHEISPWIEYGASPRASIYLGIGARAVAFLKGRPFTTPQDVKDIAHDVMRHRIILSYEGEAEGVTPDIIIDKILQRVEVP